MYTILLSHKDGNNHRLSSRYLEEVRHIPEPAGRPRANFNTMQALRTVLQEEEPTALPDVKLDLERARMERGDFRQGNAPAEARRTSRYQKSHMPHNGIV